MILEKNSQEFINLVSITNEIVQFKSEFESISTIAQQNEKGENIPTDLSTKTLQFIKQFCEIHNYKSESINYRYPFVSNQIKDNIDPLSYSFIKNILVDNLENDTKSLSVLLAAGFYLGMNKFRKIINSALQCPFYCFQSELDQQNYKKKWQITDEYFTNQSKIKIFEENRPLFEALKVKYSNQMDELFSQYILNQQQKQQQNQESV